MRAGRCRRAALAAAACAAVLVVGAGAVFGQALPEPRRPVPMQQAPWQRSPGVSSHVMQQLMQIDQLIRMGYHSRAHALLEDLTRFDLPDDELGRRRIQIAQGIGDHARAVALCREALAASPRDAWLWRELAASLVALGEGREARDALRRFLLLVGDEPRGGFSIAVEVLQQGGDCAGAVALLDSARAVLGDPRFLARNRALCLLQLGRVDESATELEADLAASPLNLQLLRRDLLASDAPPLPPGFTTALVKRAAKAGARPELAVLAANIALVQGRLDEALGVVEPRLGEAGMAAAVLQNAGSLVRELGLLVDEAEREAAGGYLLAVLPRLAEHVALPLHLRQRACDQLAETCLFALEHGLLDRDPRGAVTRFGQLLDLVHSLHPESSHLYAAQIQLARYSRDRLRDPLGAAGRLEHLLLDLDLPLPGVALARLTLGETYLAAGDSSRARRVLTSLGRDADFREAAGHAHFLLAKLDLAQGHFGTSRDRFAAVALDNPAAPYANDALALGLLVAEELQNKTGGLDLLARYARTVWWQLAAQPDSQRVALERYVDRAVRQVDQSQRQALLEHARFELADLHAAAGRTDAALEQLDRIALDLPGGRLAPRALARRAEILAAQRGDPQAARREYERLLVQYPDYLFAAEVRQRLRNLP